MNERSREAGKRICVWLQAGALVLALAAIAASGIGAWAQGQTQAVAQSSGQSVDEFANNSSPATVYQDAYSSNCDEKNGTSLAMDSPDPARCFDRPAANGQCSSIGGEDSTFAGQTGNLCHYCQGTGPLPGNEIVVPNESGGAATAAYQQGYVCSANPGDNCYLTCYGTKKFTPPAGTTLKAGTGEEGGPPPIKNANARSPLVGHLIMDVPDACHPAGVEQYNVCDYPNLPRPAGCTCPGKAPAVLEQRAPGNTPPKTSLSAQAGTCKSLFDLVKTQTFTAKQVSDLTQDVATAKATVAIANTYVAPAKWNAATTALATKYFGNASAETQATLRQDVKNVLATLSGMTSVTSTIYPTGAEILPPLVSANCIAYVHAPDTPDPRNLNKVFLCSPFWKQLPNGPDSQAMVLVHEASHLPGGANTLDYAYGAEDCGALVTFTTTGLGKVGSLISQEKLTDKSPKLVDLTDKAPLHNADSFKYFIYDVAHQAMPVAK